MFSGHLDNLDRDAAALPADILQCLRFLRQIDRGAVAGRIEIDGENAYGLVQEYLSAPREACKAEVHRLFADIQFMVSGEETIGYAPLPAGALPDEAHFEERDVGYFRSVDGESFIHLRPDAYAVFYPSDIHRPRCQAGNAPEAVRKIVIKVRV
ncbi:YhcH/YjgK/YiaL family protein [Pleomorphomonas carboxyditropha]|uniref:YhcH/YjgK/YiaL family protein n=1 Tax=Pleomorphomonas carboxyditropha TaxID=2023338 RepID=A0A2G9WXG6_9HYPH|nr:YhcH/YjgK/YiaL family protein [Pleomorphomonas carboxyditropha]PIO99425.1 hypothetical protein CJ014_08885 [Pleomorphomonas carboxyditropha]